MGYIWGMVVKRKTAPAFVYGCRSSLKKL